LKERILSYLEQAIREFRIPTLYVSHDESAASRLASQTIYLRDGKEAQANSIDSSKQATLVWVHSRLFKPPLSILRGCFQT
jgi:ABC-type molybdate transport system ATPase subunit